MKKCAVLLSVFLALDILLLAVSGWMFFQASQVEAQPQGFHAITTNAHKDMAVGQMRVPERLSRGNGFGTCEAPAEVEVRELVRSGSTIEGHDLLKVWIKDPDTPGGAGCFGFRLYRYCEEDGFWYAIYWPGWTYGLTAYLVTETEKDCDVPSDLLEEPGTYMIEIVGGPHGTTIGACTFQLPLED